VSVRWPVLAFSACLVFLTALSQIAAAESGRADLRIVVLEGDSSAGISNADVFLVLDGTTQSQVRKTGEDGTLSFPNLDAGEYRLTVRHRGFGTVSKPVKLEADTRVTVMIRLARALSVIGSVSALPPVQTSIQRVTDDSRIRRISPDLIDALNSIGGVSIRSGADGLQASFATRGRDPSQTSATLDGSSLGANAAVLALNTDLLSQASIDEQQDSFAFISLQPTQDPTFTAVGMAGGYGASFWRSTSQFTSGRIGVAAAFSERTSSSALSNQTYADLSGSTYLHVGERHTLGQYAKVTVPLSESWRFALADSVSQSLTLPIPAYFDASVPAGIGPGERVRAHTTNPILNAVGPVGSILASISASAHSLQFSDDQTNRTIFGSRFPQVIRNKATGYGLGITLSKPLTEKHSLALTYEADSSVIDSSITATPNASFGTTSALFSLDDRYWMGSESQLSTTIEASRVSGLSGYAFTSRFSRRRGNFSYFASLHTATKPVVSQGFEQTRGFQSPEDASYNCSDKTISVFAPGDSGSVARIAEADAGTNFSWRTGRASASAYYESQRNLLVTNANIPYQADTLQTPPAYIDSLRSGYSALGGCADTGPPAIFLVHNIAGENARYRGVSLFTTQSITRALLFEGEFDVTSSVLTNVDRRLDGSDAPYIAGSQLPNVPLHFASATLDWALERRSCS